MPEATAAALHAVVDESKKNIVLIMGGADKGLEMKELLAEVLKYCKKVLLLAGTGTERIRGELAGASMYGSMDEAVAAAMQSAEKGDIVLMSPAFASFGMFKNEYDRGDQFNRIVQQLS